jgi:exonuclease SbcC
MQIRSVHLKNIKSHASLQLSFTAGVNAITGHNGAGKSTILEAVGYALFDVLDYNAAQFVREGASDGSVEVTFRSGRDGRDYLVERSVKGSRMRVADCESNLVLVSGKGDVQKFVRHHLGLGETANLPHLFRQAIGVAQGALTAVFHETPKARKEVFDPLLQVDEYRTAYDNLAETSSHLKHRAQETQVTIAQLRGLVESLPEMRRTAAETARTLDEKRALLAVRSAALEQVRMELDLHALRKAAVAEAEQALRLAQMQRDNAQLALQKGQADLAAAREAARLVEANRPGHDRHLAAQTLKQQLAGRERARQALLNRRAGLAQNHARADASVDSESARLAQIEAAAATARALRAPAEQQQSLKRELEEAQERAAQLKGATDLLAAIRRQLDGETQQLSDLTAQVERAATLQNELTTLGSRLSAVDASISELAEALGRAQAEGTAAKEHLAELESADGSLCPVCRQPISPALRDRLVAEDNRLLEQHRKVYREAKAAKQAVEQERVQIVGGRTRLEGQLLGLATPGHVEKCRERIAALTQQRDDAAARMEQLAGAPALVDSLRTALQALGEPQRERDVALAQVAQRAAVEQVLAEARQSVQQLAGELAALDGELAAFATLDVQVEQADAELAATQAAFHLLLANAALAATVEARDAESVRLLAAEAAAQEAVRSGEGTLAQAQAAYAPDQHAHAAEAVTTLGATVAALNAELAMLARSLETLKVDLARLQNEERKLGDAQATLAQIEAEQRALEKMRVVIRDAGPRITRMRIARISALAAELFNELTNDYAHRLAWDEQYAITLEVEGRERAFKSLSGGEQMVAALAVRLALLKEMSGVRVAFFDEPTAHLDPDRRERLAAQIAAVKGFEQIFVISHDDTFESSTVNVVRLEKEQGATRLLTA